MTNGTGWFSRLLWAPALLTLSFAPLPAAPHPAAPAQFLPGINPAARMPPEVRLRKLHLVRPDLFPYPIEYDVYC